jgi:hypothetical protein
MCRPGRPVLDCQAVPDTLRSHDRVLLGTTKTAMVYGVGYQA